MDSLWYSMDKANWISTADALDGYWLAPLDPETRYLTAFNSILGRFEWLCTPMGLQPSSGHFHPVLRQPDPNKPFVGLIDGM